MNGQLIGGAAAVGLSGMAGALGLAGVRARWVRPDSRRPVAVSRAVSARPLAFVAGVLFTGVLLGPIMAVLVVAGGIGARWVRSIRGRARVRLAMGEQLVDAVVGLGAALRAGLSLERALRFVSEEAEVPLGDSLGRLISDIDVGVPMDAALEGWSIDNGTADARLLAGVLRLDRRSGGDLPRILDQVAATLRERREAENEVRALTAQARLSGLILGLLPIGFFLFLLITSPKDVSAALHSPIGLGAVCLGAVLEIAAFAWIRHLLEVR